MTWQALAVVASKRGIALEAAARADEAFADWRLRVGDHADHAAWISGKMCSLG